LNSLENTMSRTLLDFDGVLFSNPRVSRMIQSRSVDFIRKHMNISRREAEHVNMTWYPLHGHTALVIRHETDTRRAVERYNREVFDEEFMYKISEYIDDRDRNHLERVLIAMHGKDGPYHLCTNAPLSYCEQVLHYMGYTASDLFDMTHVFTSDNGLVKPLDAFWDYVERSLPPEEKIRLLDDSAVNILSSGIRPNWNSLLIRNDAQLFNALLFSD
jgi:phosphoglycolate phosphatase-like HAD superfamily hydrolase